MKRLLLGLLLSTLAGVGGMGVLRAQTPDCTFYFTFTANGSQPTGSGYANFPATGTTGGGVCTNWVLSYRGFGVTGSPSLLFQSALASNAVTPGTWMGYTGSVITGANPNTSATGGRWQYFPNGYGHTPAGMVFQAEIFFQQIDGAGYFILVP